MEAVPGSIQAGWSMCGRVAICIFFSPFIILQSFFLCDDFAGEARELQIGS